MSLLTKDSVVRACANAYKEGTGAESVKVGELASKILEAISSGRGLPEGIAMGKFNPSNVFGDFVIEHGLGEIPHLVIGFQTTNESTGVVVAFIKRNPVTSSSKAYSAVLLLENGGIVVKETTSNTADNSTTFTVPPTSASNIVYPMPYNYMWVAVTKEFMP